MNPTDPHSISILIGFLSIYLYSGLITVFSSIIFVYFIFKTQVVIQTDDILKASPISQEPKLKKSKKNDQSIQSKLEKILEKERYKANSESESMSDATIFDARFIQSKSISFSKKSIGKVLVSKNKSLSFESSKSNVIFQPVSLSIQSTKVSPSIIESMNNFNDNPSEYSSIKPSPSGTESSSIKPSPSGTESSSKIGTPKDTSPPPLKDTKHPLNKSPVKPTSIDENNINTSKNPNEETPNLESLTQQNKDLLQKLQTYSKKLKESQLLKTENTALRESHYMITIEYAKLRETILHSESEIRLLNNQIQSIQRNSFQKEEVDALKKELNENKSFVERLKKELGELGDMKSEVVRFRIELSDKVNEIESLGKEFNDMKSQYEILIDDVRVDYDNIVVGLKEMINEQEKIIKEKDNQLEMRIKEKDNQHQLSVNEKNHDYEMRIKEMVKNHEHVVCEMKINFDNQMNEMRLIHQKEVEKIELKLRNEIKDIQSSHQKKDNEINSHHQKEFNEIHSIHEKEINEIQSNHQNEVEQIHSNHDKEMNEIKTKHQTEVKVIELNHDEKIKEMDKQINEIHSNYDEKINEIHLNYDEKIKEIHSSHQMEITELKRQSTENYNNQESDPVDTHKLKLDNESLISELRKSNLLVESLDEVLSTNQSELDNTIESLKDNHEIKLNESIDKYENQISLIHSKHGKKFNEFKDLIHSNNESKLNELRLKHDSQIIELKSHYNQTIQSLKSKLEESFKPKSMEMISNQLLKSKSQQSISNKSMEFVSMDDLNSVESLTADDYFKLVLEFDNIKETCKTFQFENIKLEKQVQDLSMKLGSVSNPTSPTHRILSKENSLIKFKEQEWQLQESNRLIQLLSEELALKKTDKIKSDIQGNEVEIGRLRYQVERYENTVKDIKSYSNSITNSRWSSSENTSPIRSRSSSSNQMFGVSRVNLNLIKENDDNLKLIETKLKSSLQATSELADQMKNESHLKKPIELNEDQIKNEKNEKNSSQVKIKNDTTDSTQVKIKNGLNGLNNLNDVKGFEKRNEILLIENEALRKNSHIESQRVLLLQEQVDSFVEEMNKIKYERDQLKQQQQLSLQQLQSQKSLTNLKE